jgi:hypothetical protein
MRNSRSSQQDRHLSRRFDYSKKYKARLAVAREKGAEAVQEVMAEPALSNLHEVESGVVVDLFLSLRDVKSYTGMIELFYRMPPPLQRARIMREQYAFALNREGRRKTETVLKENVAGIRPVSETNGLLGRVYKAAGTPPEGGQRSRRAAT